MATLEINENLSSEKYALRHTMVLFICHKTRPFLSFEHCISDIHFADFFKNMIGRNWVEEECSNK